MNPVALTLILRGIGLVLILFVFLHGWLLNIFPGLVDYPSLKNTAFAAGAASFFGGAILHAFLRMSGKLKKPKANDKEL